MSDVHGILTQTIDLATWPRADTYRWFRQFQRPHYAVTARVDMSHVMRRRRQTGLSPYRACLYAIGAALHGEDAFLTRFRGATVVRHSRISLSMTVPNTTGGFNFAYVPWQPDAAAFDAEAAAEIARASAATEFEPAGEDADAVSFLSCLPWLDFTALDHAVPGPEDCIPRVSWGKIVEACTGHSMAVNVQVHHALVDGSHVAAFYETMQTALNRV